ncbi:hypothetical protein AAULR_16274 [Lacticaseibacillus rhamnosus MTCC 5462]|nr:hypothetical protein AAULR_16274 [Lacticaseibacillus rhamnosus MTCC 5462]
MRISDLGLTVLDLGFGILNRQNLIGNLVVQFGAFSLAA